MKLPEALQDIEAAQDFPAQEEIVLMGWKLWRDKTVQTHLAHAQETGKVSFVSRLVWAVVMIHKLQSRVAELELEKEAGTWN